MISYLSHTRRLSRPFFSLKRGFSSLSTTTTKPSYTECHGDYRAEAHLENPSLPLYLHQSELERLPVPPLEETIERFLPTALTMAENEEQVKALIQACEKFPQQAAQLQARLLHRRDRYHDSSWLQQWWNQLGYLQCRDSLFHISYFFRLTDDDSCDNALDRAACALQAAAVYAAKVESGRMPQETLGRQQTPLCSSQYKYLFHSCRIPRHGQDSFRIYPADEHPHAIAVVGGQFYALPLRDAKGAIWSRASLRRALENCILHPTLAVPELGWLTMLPRDEWAAVSEQLSSDPAMAEALQVLYSATLLLALDLDDTSSCPSSTAQRLWHGSIRHSANRWADKSIQIMVGGRGQLGYVGEHSMADGMPAIGLCNYLVDHGRVDQGDDPSASHSSATPVIAPVFANAYENMDPWLQQIIMESVEKARDDLTKRIADHELQVLTYKKYGGSAIKKAGYSPDAFVQIAMQLAGYRLFGETVGTYEATQTRRFLHGRTETTRTVSPASHAFVQAMQGSSADMNTKRKLLQEATDSHSSYTRNALAGHGVDRHFFGLSMLLEADENTPDLFKDPLYLKSKRWRMSTSTVPRARTGFSPVEPDGIGIGYDVQNDECTFSISGRTEYNFVPRMHDHLREALDEMSALFQTMTRSSSL